MRLSAVFAAFVSPSLSAWTGGTGAEQPVQSGPGITGQGGALAEGSGAAGGEGVGAGAGVAAAAMDPGRVGIHRLNNTEYNNTVRDLLGTALQPATAFLAEEGLHFDNTAASLGMT